MELALPLIKSVQYLTLHTMKLKPKAAEHKLASMMFFVLTIQNLLPSKSTANKVFKQHMNNNFTSIHKYLSHTSVKVQHLRNPHTQISSGILIRNRYFNQICKLFLFYYSQLNTFSVVSIIHSTGGKALN